jgi:heme A synthase
MEKFGGQGFARFAWGVLAFNIPVVLWGAYVRASGSGAGCGNHWPLCDGEIVPHSAGAQKLIEFTHRAMSGIDVALVVLLLIWAFRSFPKFHPARLGATLSGIFLFSEALIGAALVKLEHVARNPSTARGYSLSAHLLNTLTLLACLTLTAWWGMGKPRFRMRGREAWLAAISVGLVAVLGISGAIAALGDTLFPAKSLAEGFAQDLDPAANIFLRLRLLHPMLAAAVAGWLIFYAATGMAAARKQAMLVGAALMLQLTAGTLNLLLLAPVPMQMIHLLLADLLWIALVMLCASRLAKA